MAVNVNLSRNTKVYFTTQLADTGYGDHNTSEIQVLNGYTFSQGTEQETIQINEAGATPNRGQRSFNSKLNPVEWGFTTYIRPKKYATAVGGSTTLTASAGPSVTYFTTTGGVTVAAEATFTLATGTVTSSACWYTIAGLSGTNNGLLVNTTTPVPLHRAGSNTVVKVRVPITCTGSTLTGTATFTSAQIVTCAEHQLWNALVSPGVYMGTGAGNSPGWTPASTSATLAVTNSNVHQLAEFALIFKVDNVHYKVKGCAINQAEINFGIDQIAQIAWSGFGTSYVTFDSTSNNQAVTELTALTAADTTANYITNKLSTVSIGTGLRGASTGSNGVVLNTATPTYSVAITGGAFTVNNNLTYLTPENLGVVNNTIGYFTGTRAVTGNLTAYLRTGGTTETGDLLTAIVNGAATSSENKFSAVISIGGVTNNTHIEIPMDGLMLQVPAVEVQDVVSTTLNFTAQSVDSGTHPNAQYLITNANEFGITYKTI